MEFSFVSMSFARELLLGFRSGKYVSRHHHPRRFSPPRQTQHGALERRGEVPRLVRVSSRAETRAGGHRATSTAFRRPSDAMGHALRSGRTRSVRACVVLAVALLFAASPTADAARFIGSISEPTSWAFLAKCVPLGRRPARPAPAEPARPFDSE